MICPFCLITTSTCPSRVGQTKQHLDKKQVYDVIGHAAHSRTAKKVPRYCSIVGMSVILSACLSPPALPPVTASVHVLDTVSSSVDQTQVSLADVVSRPAHVNINEHLVRARAP